MSNKNKQPQEWKRIEDIKTFRTSNPKEMLNKYLTENVFRKWFDDFLDDDTGQIVTIERAELIAQKGDRLTKDEIQKIMFHIQAGDITDVEVTEERITAERWIGEGQTPCEVVISDYPKKETYLVKSQSLENAIKIATEYATLYNGLEGTYTIKKAEFKNYIIIENDDPCMEDPNAQPPIDLGIEDEAPKAKNPAKIEYYQTKLKTMFVDLIDNTMNVETYDIVLPAGDVGQAKERTIRWAKRIFEKDLNKDSHNKVKVIKAQEYNVAAVPPADYCKMFRIDTGK